MKVEFSDKKEIENNNLNDKLSKENELKEIL